MRFSVLSAISLIAFNKSKSSCMGCVTSGSARSTSTAATAIMPSVFEEVQVSPVSKGIISGDKFNVNSLWQDGPAAVCIYVVRRPG